MKKLLLLLLCVPLIGMGQDNKIKIGLEVGPSITFVRGDLPRHTNKTLCFSGGLSFEYSLQKMFSIRTNILYERKAAMQDITFTDLYGNIIGEDTYGYNYDYLTIPILAKYSFGAINKFFINTGPYFSYLMKGSFNYGDVLVNGTSLPDEVVTNRFHRLDVGLIFGFGGEFRIHHKLLLTIEPRYNLGMTNFLEDDHWYFQNGFHNSINLLAGISYISGNIK